MICYLIATGEVVTSNQGISKEGLKGFKKTALQVGKKLALGPPKSQGSCILGGSQLGLVVGGSYLVWKEGHDQVMVVIGRLGTDT